MYHYRKTRNTYRRHNRSDQTRHDCTFCRDETREATLQENDTMFVIRNRVKYDVFEGLSVLEHLMVIPKKHHDTMATFSDKEMLDMMRSIAEYEARGYGVYARGVGSVTRSVAHQHTHLLKLDSRQHKLMVSIKKPYTLIRF